MAGAHLASFELVAGIHISSVHPDILELAVQVEVRDFIDIACEVADMRLPSLTDLGLHIRSMHTSPFYTRDPFHEVYHKGESHDIVAVLNKCLDSGCFKGLQRVRLDASSSEAAAECQLSMMITVNDALFQVYRTACMHPPSNTAIGL